jgi:hypothetical protein
LAPGRVEGELQCAVGLRCENGAVGGPGRGRGCAGGGEIDGDESEIEAVVVGVVGRLGSRTNQGGFP